MCPEGCKITPPVCNHVQLCCVFCALFRSNSSNFSKVHKTTVIIYALWGLLAYH